MLAQEILRDELKYDDLAIVDLPEPEMTSDVFHHPIQWKHQVALILGQHCQNKESTELNFIIIQTAGKFYRTNQMVENWIQTSKIEVNQPAVICIDFEVQNNTLPAYGTLDYSHNYRYIIPGTFPKSSFYPEHCKGSYIITAPAIKETSFEQLKTLENSPEIH